MRVRDSRIAWKSINGKQGKQLGQVTPPIQEGYSDLAEEPAGDREEVGD